MTDHERAIEAAARASRALQLGKDEWDDLPEAIRIVWIGLAAETVKAYLAALGDGWQPIETAPRDGTRVLLFAPATKDRAAVVRNDYWWSQERAWAHMRPDHSYTHWRPLPAPPRDVRDSADA